MHDVNYPTIKVETLGSITPTNNRAIIRHIANSTDDFTRKVKIELVRNEGNRRRERSIGKVVKLSNESYVMVQGGHLDISEDLYGQYVIYDTHSRECKIESELNPEGEYYLIRVPDIVAVIDKYKE